MPKINKDYIATKIFTNKRSLESKKDIVNNIEQYVGVNENILLDTHATIQQAIKNNLYNIKENGKTETIGARRERKKAKMKSTSKKLWLLPLIGWIIYAILYGTRRSGFTKVKDEEKRQLQSALINALESNPLFLQTAEQYISNLKGEEKEMYKECLNIAKQHINDAPEEQYGNILNETLDYLQTEHAVSLDKAVLEEMYQNNVPSEIKEKLKQKLSNEKIALSMDPQLNNANLWQKYKKQPTGIALGGSQK